MAEKKGSLIGLLIILGCIVYSSGLSAGWNFVKKIVFALGEVGKFFATMAIRFHDILGITDWLWTNGVYIIIIVAGAVAGYSFTRKEKKKLLGVISSVVAVVSLLLSLI